MAQRMFTVLSHLPSGVRAALLGGVTGTRGDHVVYRRADSPGQRVALTIDDAPSQSAAHFRQLLDVLAHLQVRVSFQVISDYVRLSDEHRELMVRAAGEGHHLVNHSTMDQPCVRLSEAEFVARLRECQEVVDELQPPSSLRRRFFRPPSGVMNSMMRDVTAREGYTVCLGDTYSHDARVHNVEYHVETLLRGARPGSIIIMHCPEANHRAQTLEVLPRLVTGLRHQGFEIVTMDELFA